MNIDDIKTIDDYIRFAYPEPKPEDDKEYNFFARWGYEQWLIMHYKHDLEQLRILLMDDYNRFRVAKFAENKESLVGLPIIRSKKILHGFLASSVPKGFYGLCLWETDNNEYFCIFPGGGVFTQFFK
jgi:hypothetical protein